MSKDQHNVPKFALGTAIAAVVGYLAGILTAPKSGKDTRTDIKNTANQAMAEADKTLKALHTQLNDLLDQAKVVGDKLSGQAKAELDSLVAKANTSRQKAREVISGIHEGEADDKDLQSAIKDAQKAVDHLKVYLKK